MKQTIIPRETKYTKEVSLIISKLGHATNAELLNELQKIYPEVSATTVHRSTARLAERGILGVAPSDTQGSMRYDANTQPHDHFVCTNCGGIRDIVVAENIIPTISSALGGCKITGRLLIQGSCETCLKNVGEK
jgi:Fur family peroxide stress response transcriptional regulator